MRVRFLETRTVQAVNGETFVAGAIYDLSLGSARRWIARGVAVEVVAEPEPEAAEPAQGGKGEPEGGEGSGDASPPADGAPTRLTVPADLPEDRDALAVLAESMGLKVHHWAGVDRIREQIEEARAAAAKTTEG